MERVNKALLVLTVVAALLGAVSLEAVEGARVLRSVDQNKQEQVDHPETFYGGIVGGSYPGGFSGVGFGPNGFYTIPGSGTGAGGLGGGPVSGLPDISTPPSLGATKP